MQCTELSDASPGGCCGAAFAGICLVLLSERLGIPECCTDPRLNDVLNFRHLFKCFSHITGWDVNAGY